MAYIGQEPVNTFSPVPTKDSFTGDGSTTAFDLQNEVVNGGENALEVYVNNVRQEPGTGKAFTLGVDGSDKIKRITFTAAPISGASIYVINDKTSNVSIMRPEDLNGVEFVLDADGDTSITADTDDRIDFRLNGVDHINIGTSSGDTVFSQMTDAKDIIFKQYDGRNILEINDAGFIAIGNGATGSGQLRIYEDTDNGTNFSAFQVGTQSADITYTLPTADGTSGYQLTTDGSGTLSWAAAQIALANDGNNRIVTGTGSSSLNAEANLTFDGSTLTNAGATQLNSTLTIGANDQGYDVILYGDTASANVTWDTSVDDLIFNGGAGLIVPDGQLTLGSTAVTSTAAELNLLDNVSGLVQADLTKLAAIDATADEIDLIDGSSANTVVNSKAVIYGSSGELAGTLSTVAQTNITSVGTLTALTVDDVAVDGKIIVMTGSTDDTFTTTVGTNGATSLVTVDTAGAAGHLTITADGTVDINSAGILTLDSGAAINIEPAAGSAILLDGAISIDAGVVTGATSITSTAFVGALTGNVTGNASGTAATVTTAAQPNITSLGTLTTLTVDNVIINGTTIGHTGDTDLMTVGSAILTVAGEVQMTTLDIGGTNVSATAAELNYSDLATLGTTAASKVITADANNLTTVSGALANVEDVLTDGATVAWNVINSPVAKLTLGGNRTLSAPSGTTPISGQFISLLAIQDGTGSRTITWNAAYEFATDTAPTLTTTANLGDVFTFRYNGAKWLEVGRNLALTLS
jgi:hypothetical protein